MKIVYKNVDSSSLSILDQWIIDKNSDIVKYAMFDYSFTSYEKILKEKPLSQRLSFNVGIVPYSIWRFIMVVI